jgi:RimJ/RimL family protein N-acetyltransferase
MDARTTALPEIIDWYSQRGQTPWLAVPDRLLDPPPKAPAHMETVVMVRDLPAGTSDAATTLAPRPDAVWLRLFERDVSAVGRAAVTSAPNDGRWAGISAVRVADHCRREGHAHRLCSALMSWAGGQGAQKCYVQVLVDNAPAIALYERLGFIPQHRTRYFDARSL